MQVMTSAEFEQTEVLVGRQGKTESFGVSEDPALMMMLSTGLYSDPHRTMIQEIMFNAWDAHHMVGIQATTPIDIYINDTTGLIVRDYGPGIAKEMMTPIYCIYGASTKRDDKGSTGGFGLGSKSPYAYTESFTVSSYHKGIHNMYLMSRVSDENDGKPGKTPIIEDVPTQESGLRVIVPLKSESDMEKTYDHIKDLLFLSGIWANIHYMDKPVETIKADKVPAAGWFMEDGTQYQNKGIWAVYGGVRYRIPHRDEYTEEFEFIRRIANKMRVGIFIGFAPDSLTPLPSREGLNMSDRTIENIKSMLETLMEFLESTIKPALRFSMDYAMKQLKETEIDPMFLSYRWRDIGSFTSFKDAVGGSTEYVREDSIPEGVPESSWISINRLCWQSTNEAADLIGWSEFHKMKAIVWAKAFPKMKLLNYISHGEVGKPMRDEERNHYWLFGTKIIQESNKMLDELKGMIDQSLTWRVLMHHREGWTKVDGWRGKRPISNRRRSGHLWGRDKIISDLMKAGKLKTPARERKDAFFEPDGDQLGTVFIPKVVMIAKTATALNDTPLHVDRHFATKVPLTERERSYQPFHWSNFQDSNRAKPILGLVVHKKKGEYDLAVEHLKAAGWTVIEAYEPEVPQKKTVMKRDSNGTIVEVEEKKSSKPTFPVFNHDKKYFYDEYADEIETPKFYLWCTRTAIEADSWTDRADRPSSSLRQWVGENLTDVAYLGNKARIVTVERIGAKSIPQEIEDRANKILSNEDRILKMVLHQYLKNKSSIPRQLLTLPEMQKFFKIPYLRTSEIEQFETDRLFLGMVQEERWSEINYDLKQKIKTQLDWRSYDDTLFSGVAEMCEKSRVIDSRAMESEIHRYKPGELKTYSEKLMRFLRTI